MATQRTKDTKYSLLKIPIALFAKIKNKANGNIHGYLIDLLKKIHKVK